MIFDHGLSPHLGKGKKLFYQMLYGKKDKCRLSVKMPDQRPDSKEENLNIFENSLNPIDLSLKIHNRESSKAFQVRSAVNKRIFAMRFSAYQQRYYKRYSNENITRRKNAYENRILRRKISQNTTKEIHRTRAYIGSLSG